MTVDEWDALVRKHTPAVLRIACRILGIEADAEDVAQDVFVEAWQLRATQQVRNWPGLLRRITVMRSLDRLRQRQRRNSVPYDEKGLADHRDSPQSTAIERELTQRLREGLCDLPEQQAAAFSLFYFEHLSREEVAAALSTTPGAVSTALSKARRSLKALLTERDSER